MNEQEYYTAPSDEIFNDIKENAIKIWMTYSDEFGYQTEKVQRVNRLQNIEDNAWYIVAMFDCNNQEKLLEMVKPETKVKLAEVLAWGRQ
jgi:hypothetical protein